MVVKSSSDVIVMLILHLNVLGSFRAFIKNRKNLVFNGKQELRIHYSCEVG